MSYDLAVWVGSRPASDAAAAEEYERRTAYFEDPGARPLPASHEIRGFASVLLAQYPALGSPGDEDSPWAIGPEPGDIDGNFIYLTMTYPGARAAMDYIVGCAHRLGLVCYDPQLRALA